ASMLAPLDEGRRQRLVAAMAEVERLLLAGSVEVAVGSPESADARFCLESYFRELKTRFETGFELSDNPSPDPNEVTPPAGGFVVARLYGEPIGCGALTRIDAATGEIKRVWTSPSRRGLGVARKMLHALESLAREMGLTRLRLDTNRALTEAHALYRTEGFAEVERFNDNPYAHHWFEKRL
ncbi:MAG TPA: GNAT family N-acetyltransferase, partial [Roseiarcus sp.]|nr:GNAT family N-acetyltransferase [Roseiarcus sp.]